MTLQQIVSQLLERGNAMQSFWGLYISISLGFIAFFGSAKRSPHLAALMSLAFTAFAYVNVDGMTDIAEQRVFLWQQLDTFIAASQPTAGALSDAAFASGIKTIAQPPDPGAVMKFHIGCDIAILVAIWFLTLWRGNAQSKVGMP